MMMQQRPLELFTFAVNRENGEFIRGLWRISSCSVAEAGAPIVVTGHLPAASRHGGLVGTVYGYIKLQSRAIGRFKPVKHAPHVIRPGMSRQRDKNFHANKTGVLVNATRITISGVECHSHTGLLLPRPLQLGSPAHIT